MKCSFIVKDEIKPFKLRTKGPKYKVQKSIFDVADKRTI
jgi:hypothetical protein